MFFITTKKPIKTTHPKLGEVGTELEIPQFDTLQEAVQDAGSEDALRDYVNNSLVADAKVGPRNVGKTAGDSATVESIIEKMRELSKSISLKNLIAGRAAGKQAKAEAFDAVKAKVLADPNMTREDILALINSLGR